MTRTVQAFGTVGGWQASLRQGGSDSRLEGVPSGQRRERLVRMPLRPARSVPALPQKRPSALTVSERLDSVGDWSTQLGKVPIVRLNRLTSECRRVQCLLKLESCNPGGSIKEKNAVHLVNLAEKAGLLKPGGTIIESSSGNFGLGLAMVGAARGYSVIIVIDTKTTPAFRKMLQAHGAQLEVVRPEELQGQTMQAARIARATQLSVTIPRAWYPCQHYNPQNPEAHALLTATELEAAFGEQLDVLVAGVSTGGQLSGLARYLKPRYPHLRLIGVDVEGSVILGTPAQPYKMTGMGLSFRPPHLDYHHLSQGYVVPEALAFSVCHALARQEGLLLGASTGAIVAAGLRAAADLPSGARVVMINPDRGDRYLDTVYDPQWLSTHGFRILPSDALEPAIRGLKPVPHLPR